MKSNKNILFSLVNVLVSAIQSLWLLSFVQNIMGVEAYGYIAVVTSVVNMANIATMAFTTFTSRFVTINLHQGKEKKANRYFNASFFSLLTISVVCGIVFWGMAMGIDLWMNIDGKYIAQVRVLLLLTAGSFLISTVSTPLKAGIYYTNKIYIMHGLQIGSYLSRIIFALVLYKNYMPLLWYAYAGSFLFDVISLAIYFILYKRLMPSICISYREFRWKETKEILFSGLWVSINKSGASLLTTANTYLISIIVSAYMTGIYSTITQFVSFVGMLTMALVSCVVPTIYRLYAEGQNEKLYSYLSQSTKMLAVFIGIIVGGMIIYERFLLALMMDKIYLRQSLLIILTVIEIPFTYPANIVEQVLIAYNKFTFPAISQLIVGVLNVGMIFIMYKLCGANVYTIVIIGGILSFIRNTIFLPIYNQYVSGYRKGEYFRRASFGFLSAIITVSISLFISCMIRPVMWRSFIISVLLSATVSSAIISYFFFSEKERKNIWSILKRESK